MKLSQILFFSSLFSKALETNELSEHEIDKYPHNSQITGELITRLVDPLANRISNGESWGQMISSITLKINVARIGKIVGAHTRYIVRALKQTTVNGN